MSLISSSLSDSPQQTTTTTTTPSNNINNNNNTNNNPLNPTTPNISIPIPNSTTPLPTPTPIPITPTPTTPTNTTTTTTTPTPTPTPPTTTTTTTTSTPSVATPTPIPTTNSTAPLPATTQIQTITTGSGNDASVVVITQTAFAPTSTSDANTSKSNDNPASASTSKIIAIAIPSAIGALAAIIILIMGIRALLRRSAAKRAADDIRWPETVTSEGDRAALYPEPTRPSPGHGLGLVEDEEEHTSPEMNMAGAGAGRLRPGVSIGPTRPYSVTTTGLSATSHYQPFEYGNTPDYPSHRIPPPPPPPPPSHLPSTLMPAYGMNQSNGIVTYPPDWDQNHHRNGFGNDHSPEMIARSNGPTRTSLIYPNESYSNWDSIKDQEESDLNHSSSQPQQQAAYLLPPINTMNIKTSSSPSFIKQTLSNAESHEEIHQNRLDGPRELQYAPYSHGGYGGSGSGGEVDEESNHVLDHSHHDHHDDSISIQSDLKGSPEWKLGVNNPDTDS